MNSINNKVDKVILSVDQLLDELWFGGILDWKQHDTLSSITDKLHDKLNKYISQSTLRI